MSFLRFIVFIILISCHESWQQIPRVILPPQDLLTMQIGKGWPHALQVVEGHEVLLRIDQQLETLESCVITTPTGEQFNVRSPPDSRYEAWSDTCGVRIKNVVPSDEGRWRLNATGGGDVFAGWSSIHVEKDTPSYSGSPIQLLDGAIHTLVNLTTLNNSYCVVAQPFSESSLIPGHCRVTLDKTTRAVQGNWNVLLGLPGKVEEIQVQRTISVETERLDVGYLRDTSANKLHLYCNIMHTEKNITFCRFQKTNSAVGYNVMDGLGDGVHSYYGDGFLHRDCGMTIEQPSAQDYGTWRCSVGVQQWVGNKIEQQTPLQALISVGPEASTSRLKRFIHRSNEEEERTVFVQERQSFTVSCRADESLSYCWLQHPNGSSFTPVPLQTEDQPFWYTGENLQVGDCGITFHYATTEENGIWTCHMGPREVLGMEITERVEVRVTGSLAANKKEISAEIGDTVNLYCHTSNGNRPLEYCRFLSPTAMGIRVDSTLTEENAILGRYYFMPNKNLNYGDCALTIKDLKAEDIGEWTCASLVIDEYMESSDTITVDVTETINRSRVSRAGIAGMAVGACVLCLTLAGVALYKTRQGWLPRGTSTSSVDMFALDNISGITSRQSNGSNNSDGSSLESRTAAEIMADIRAVGY